jgi:site-specific recombinase XerD
LERAGIKKRHMGLHLFRHTFGRQFIAGGGDLVTAQKLMGHSVITTTRLYTELSGEDVHKRHQAASPLRQLKLNFKELEDEKEQPISQ